MTLEQSRELFDEFAALWRAWRATGEAEEGWFPRRPLDEQAAANRAKRVASTFRDRLRTAQARAERGTGGGMKLNPTQDWTIEAADPAIYPTAQGFAREVPSLGLPDPFSSTFRLQPGANYTDPSLAPTHPSKTTSRSERYYIKDATYIESGERWLFDFWFKPHSPWPASDGGANWCSLAQWHQRGGGTPPLQLVNEGSANSYGCWPARTQLRWCGRRRWPRWSASGTTSR